MLSQYLWTLASKKEAKQAYLNPENRITVSWHKMKLDTGAKITKRKTSLVLHEQNAVNIITRGTKDTYVINGTKGETSVWEAGKAISIQPSLQGSVLKHTDSGIHSWCQS